MEITWEDGSKVVYSGEQLRWACPCAECRGEAGSPGRLARVKTLSPEELNIKDVALVGQYALQVAFESGHATGIYTFPYLRALGSSESRSLR
jgi:DUF971 family protein